MSMDGRGRVVDTIFQERLWRSVKDEEVYVHAYDSVNTATHRIGNYVDLDNKRRLHEALGYVPPAEIDHNASYNACQQGGVKGNLNIMIFCLDNPGHLNLMYKDHVVKRVYSSHLLKQAWE